jgi:hypothetical protein
MMDEGFTYPLLRKTPLEQIGLVRMEGLRGGGLDLY